MNIEEDVIETLNKIIKFYKDLDILYNSKEPCPEIRAIRWIITAYETLLTAYEKEKEKNKELEKMIKKDKDALQFKVGDIVRLKYKSPCTFAIEEGAVCKITNIERQARYPIEIENKFNGIKGYVAEDYIEKIEVEE